MIYQIIKTSELKRIFMATRTWHPGISDGVDRKKFPGIPIPTFSRNPGKIFYNSPLNTGTFI